MTGLYLQKKVMNVEEMRRGQTHITENPLFLA